MIYRSKRMQQLERDYFETQDPKERRKIYELIEKEDREEYLANLLGLTIAGLFFPLSWWPFGHYLTTTSNDSTI